ncbi:MAG: GNAT family N-acetyltransferase [Gammaproteobacteria bacterium]
MNIDKTNISNLTFSLHKECSPTHPICEALRNQVRGYNFSKVGAFEINNYILAYHNENNNLMAGLCACCRLGVFNIELLWVDESLRKQRLGSRLLEKAEECARKDNAIYMKVNTATFQALDFYLKNGYEVFAKLPIFVANIENQYDYFLIKHLKR